MDNKTIKNNNNWLYIAEVAAEFLKRCAKPVMDYDADYFTKLRTIREYYEQQFGEYIDNYNKTGHQYYNPYAYDWARIFTPIEFSAWCSIRAKGLPMYPQYPADKYMLDFGNPFIKIGIELDGKGYHEKSKDTIRDTKLKSLGWTIIRITGSEMEKTNYEDVISDFDLYRQSEDEYNEALRYWFMHTGDGIIDAINIEYFKGVVYAPDEYWEQRIRTLAKETIYKHTLI